MDEERELKNNPLYKKIAKDIPWFLWILFVFGIYTVIVNHLN